MLLRPDVEHLFALVATDDCCVIVMHANFDIAVILDALCGSAFGFGTRFVADPNKEFLRVLPHQFFVLVVGDIEVLQAINYHHIWAALSFESLHHVFVVETVPKHIPALLLHL